MSAHSPDIYLTLGIDHSTHPKLKDFSASIQRVKKLLKTTEGQIVYVIEDPTCPAALARIIDYTSQGSSPMYAYIGSIMLHEKGELLDGAAREEFLGEYFKTHPYHQEIKALDRLWGQYPNRVRLMMEEIPEAQLGLRFTDKGERKSTVTYVQALEKARQGEFTEAVNLFKESVLEEADFTTGRQLILESKIHNIMFDPKVSAVVVRYRNGSIELARSLTRRGHMVQATEFHRTPYEDMVALSSPLHPAVISELEWYQALLAELMESSLSETMLLIHNKIYPKMVSQSVNDATQHIATMDQVRDIEARIRQAIESGGNYLDVLQQL